MRIAAIIFHKNVQNYRPEWIAQCVKSIQNQTYKKFDVFELDYGGDGAQIYPGSVFESKEMPTHAHAHNFLLDKACFWGYDYIFNVNVDDYYTPDRFEKQLVFAEQGYDVISSNFYFIDENGNIKDTMVGHYRNIIEEANKEINIICHPVVCYSRKFWTTCSRLIPEEIPRDDFELWKRSFDKYKFIVLPDFLMYYRVHGTKISKGIQVEPPIINTSNASIPVSGWTEEQKRIHDAKREEWLKTNR